MVPRVLQRDSKEVRLGAEVDHELREVWIRGKQRSHVIDGLKFHSYV